METTSTPRYLSRLPIRLQNKFVSYFPRKSFGFLGHAVQDKYYSHPFLLYKLLRAGAAPQLPSGYHFGLIDDAKLQQIISHREALPASVYHNRLAKGDVCYVLTVNDEIVSLQWISTSQCGIFRGFDKCVDFLALEPHQAYTYDFYTYTDQRNRGYGTVLKQQLIGDLVSKQYSELLTCVMHNNLESLRVHMKLNYGIKGLPCNFRVMDWQWTTWGSDKEVNDAGRWLEHLSHNFPNRKQQS